MLMEKKVLDYVLVPSGLFVLVTYHLWLLYRILKHPNRTVIGINAVNRRFWVRAMMEVNSSPFTMDSNLCCGFSICYMHA
jgi:hypothetical protein